MSGGNLVAMGDCGPCAGSAMSGGRLEIAGDAGGFLGAPLEGEMEGMTGGVLIVRGNAGERAGDRLRRGTVVIEGSAGDYPGSRMIAGTLIVLGECGSLPGYLMRRGTIVLANPPELGPAFVDCGTHDLAFASVFSGLLAPQKPRRREVFFPARSSVSPETWRLSERAKFSSPHNPHNMAAPEAAAGLRRGNLRDNNFIRPPSIKGCRANG